MLQLSRGLLALALLVPAAVSPPPGQERGVASLRVVKDVYREDGISIRHLGVLEFIPVAEPRDLEPVLQTPALSLMNLSLARDMRGMGEDPAYSVGVHDAFVGFEGLVFDRERAFDPDDAWESSIASPEAALYKFSPDKPRPDPRQRGRIVVDWDPSWPNSSARGDAEGESWVHHSRIVSLLQRSSHAYYHFLCEALPKIVLLTKDIEAHPDSKVLVDISYGNDWTLQLLSLLGFTPDRIIVRKPGKVYHANTVIFARPTPLHRPYPQLLQGLASELRHRVSMVQGLPNQPWLWGAEASGRTVGPGSAIVVVRRTPKNNQHTHQHVICKLNGEGGCRIREITNADEMIEAIAAAFPRHEVVPFDSLGFSLVDQIRLFQRAGAVVGSHGAGLANTMFAPAGGILLELIPHVLQRASIVQIFWHVAVGVGVRHATLIVPQVLMEASGQRSLHNFRAPIKEVVAALRSLFTA